MATYSYVPSYERENMLKRLREMGFKSYESYLRSGLWGSNRRRLAQDRCESCSSRRQLVLHHMTYARLGAEQPEDVCTLCSKCHRSVHLAARRSGSLYPAKVIQKRNGTSPRAKDITAQRVICPVCNAKTGQPCFLPSGNVRTLEHKERRVLSQQYLTERKAAKRRRRAKKSARDRKLTDQQAQVIEAAREAEFPLEELRKRAGRLAR